MLREEKVSKLGTLKNHEGNAKRNIFPTGTVCVMSPNTGGTEFVYREDVQAQIEF